MAHDQTGDAWRLAHESGYIPDQRKQYHTVCNVCQAWGDVYAHTDQEARKLVESHGWKWLPRGKGYLCSHCRAKEPRAKQAE